MIVSAISRMVISCGLPMLTGSFTFDSIRRMMPSTRSVMYVKLRVCDPSPKIVTSSLRRAWLMNAGTARPSLTRMRGPYVLKIRTIFASSPWNRWYATVIASANRLASSYTPRGPMGFTLPQ